jgi:hypothetical protein
MADKRYIKFSGDNGYCGNDYEEYQSFDKDTTDETISQISERLAYENAENFAYLATSSLAYFELEEDEEEYYYNAMMSCGWEEITEEEFNENS